VSASLFPLRARFAQLVSGATSPRVAVAPGRVNLIGEHTDYNDGFVLPMAIESSVRIAFAPRPDRTLRVQAVSYGETRDLALDALVPRSIPGWAGYVAGTAWALEHAGHRLTGIDAVIESDAPSFWTAGHSRPRPCRSPRRPPLS
jgi:galactokinase